MVNFVTLVSAILSIIALVLAAVGMATNHWIDVTEPRSTATSAREANPVVTNTKLPGLTVSYNVHHYGLWVGCHVERSFGEQRSCAYIGNRCYSDVCWIRNDRDTTCLDAKVTLVDQSCTSYQFTRVLVCLGMILLVMGTSLLVVASCVTSGRVAASGSGLTLLSSLLLCIAFVVFYVKEYAGVDGASDWAKLGWSFVLLIISWPVAAVAAIVGALGAVMVRDKDDGVEDIRYDDQPADGIY
ncbi:hypothetical protein BU14_2088s0002 [Porphyra umbilicalis]|uniref:Claudin n=1 Tax=Porphyra umbilicalis TaxID=2786 RepID=A0A1X6NK28_PORUM|nr:hypothetical protein BU14_2088s0002 [Porphyra umbilicalis]|eukprot:OSX68922.1 hypothetical protein BU14_2088s0002 [Porphyra umbilicalis]